MSTTFTLSTLQELELGLFEFNYYAVEFVDRLNQNAPASTWPALEMYREWAKCDRGVQLLGLYERVHHAESSKKNAAQLAGDYGENVGYLDALEEELGSRMSRAIAVQFSAKLESWSETLKRVRANGFGEDEESADFIEDICLERDALEWAWRGCALAKQESAARLPGVEPNKMRERTSTHDRELALLLGDRRMPNALADETMWWRIIKGHPEQGIR